MLINKLYDATINGELMGKMEDTQETKITAARLEGFMDGALNEKQAAIINGFVADYAYQNGKQFFALGFKAAMQLFADCVAGAING